MRPFTLSLALGVALAPIAVCVAGPIPIVVTTTGAFSATYATVSQTSPTIPWSDIGFQATASTTQGTLSSTVGGGTQYQLTSSISGGQTLAPGDTIDLGYTPGWTGSMTTQANGKLGINFAYNIGPFSGHVPVLTDSMNTGVSGLDLSSALNSGSPLSAGATTHGPGISATLGMNALVASASVHFNVGSQVAQNLNVAPTVTYGDYVWYTNDVTAASTTPTPVDGGGGGVSNTFAPDIGALGLMTGANAIDMNILPFAALSLGVGNESIVSIPASITYSYNVFGASGGGSIASGNLYSLSTGFAGLTASGAWYATDAYSIELNANCNFNSLAAHCTYQTDGTTPLDLSNFGIPSNVPLGSTPPGPPSGGGSSSDFPNLGPLVPGDTPCVRGIACKAPCDPATGLECITQVNLTGSVPEPDALWLLSSGVLLLGFARRHRQG